MDSLLYRLAEGGCYRKLRAISGASSPMAMIAPAIAPRRSDSRLFLSVMPVLLDQLLRVGTLLPVGRQGLTAGTKKDTTLLSIVSGEE